MSVSRQLVLLLFLAVAGGLGYMMYQERPAATESADAGGQSGAPRPAAAVDVATAATRVLERSVEAVGTTRALQSVDIVPLTDGRLVELNITPGAAIDRGDVIARLDPGIEQATLAEAEATLAERTAALDRSTTLRQTNASTVSQATLDSLKAEVAAAEAAVQRARHNLQDRTISAPFSGVLGMRAVDLGARVETSMVLTTLDDLSEVEIEFRLPETVYGQIHIGQRIHAESAAFPGRTFSGSVAAIDSRIDSVSRSFRVHARLPNEDRVLPVGMFMRLDLALDDRHAVVVPEEAVMVEGGKTEIFVVVDGVAELRSIETGLRRAGIVEVLDGVADGDTVVSRGIQSVRDGGAVRIISRIPLPGHSTEIEVPGTADAPASPAAAAKPEPAGTGSRT
ncbi:efflux RND transporter periplasmic adaptor subunit [Acuticoccus sediminis]|uniref:efflux RND transporter periplasmic adaptor subunit n=1 Tax=Acuticoccus sediminis TaxID=2184697 RepID=UPI001CFE52D2|nr:efflux RND transporter periplasmic adaptor subunit [Acuticoccus sediminis]